MFAEENFVEFNFALLGVNREIKLREIRKFFSYGMIVF